MITAIDDVVGDLLRALEATRQTNNTVVVYTSDNGAPTGTPLPPHSAGGGGYSVTRNYPLKGRKGQLWEGGVRVPALVWSAAIARSAARGTRSLKLYHVTDWLPTFASLAGVMLEAGGPSDTLGGGRGSKGRQHGGGTVGGRGSSDGGGDGGDVRAGPGGFAATARTRPLDGHDIWGSLLDPATPSPRTEVSSLVGNLFADRSSNAPSPSPPHTHVKGGALTRMWCIPPIDEPVCR